MSRGVRRSRSEGDNLAMMDLMFCAFGGVVILAVIFAALMGGRSLAPSEPPFLLAEAHFEDPSSQSRAADGQRFQLGFRVAFPESDCTVSYDVGAPEGRARGGGCSALGGLEADFSVVQGRSADLLLRGLPPGRSTVEVTLSPFGIVVGREGEIAVRLRLRTAGSGAEEAMNLCKVCTRGELADRYLVRGAAEGEALAPPEPDRASTAPCRPCEGERLLVASVGKTP